MNEFSVVAFENIKISWSKIYFNFMLMGYYTIPFGFIVLDILANIPGSHGKGSLMKVPETR